MERNYYVLSVFPSSGDSYKLISTNKEVLERKKKEMDSDEFEPNTGEIRQKKGEYIFAEGTSAVTSG